jgi:hypothetical protein
LDGIQNEREGPSFPRNLSLQVVSRERESTVIFAFGKPIAEIPPNPPLKKGGRGDFWVILSEGKTVAFFQGSKD